MPSEPFSFNEAGDGFSLYDFNSLEKADFDLWNDAFCVKAEHNGHVDGRVYTPNAQPYADEIRPVYCMDRQSGETWSLNWGPLFKDPESMAFSIHLDHVSWKQDYKGITTTASLSVPRGAGLEAWQVAVENRSTKGRRLRLVPALPTGLLGLLSHESVLLENPFGILHNYFPYYVKIPDYAKMADRWNTTFFFPDKKPDSWTALERDFLGRKGWGNPEGLLQEVLGGRHCHYERGMCAAAYDIELAPGEAYSLGWIFGPARHPRHAQELREKYPPASAFKQAVEEQRAFQADQHRPLRLKAPDKAFSHYINHWSPDRCIRIGRTYRFNPSPQARNAIQDTMTLALFDAATARERFLSIWRHQESNGFMPHGLPMVENAELMAITLIPHKDTNVWGPLAIDLYLRETGDLAFLDATIPYVDEGEDSLAGHLENGLHWLLGQRSPRGLSLIGQGDWNDPLNMAGPEGRGESIWLTEALVYSLEVWARLCRMAGRPYGKWESAAGECREAVLRHGWDGDWFLRATSDNGTPIGSKTNLHGSIYLNAQSWAMMAGIPDKEQESRIIASVEKHLGTRIAPAVLGPAYPGMDPNVGKLTLKSPGTGENGSVYSHAALFWSYALYQRGYASEAWRVLRNLVPGGPGNPVREAGQVPLYIPNFYRGPASPDVFGRSSHAPNTGSAAWVYMTFIEKVIGLKGDGDKLLVQPALPPEWDRVSGDRIFRGTCYRFTMERTAGLKEMRVEVDGVSVKGAIAWAPADKPVQLRVALPAGPA